MDSPAVTLTLYARVDDGELVEVGRAGLCSDGRNIHDTIREAMADALADAVAALRAGDIDGAVPGH